MLLCCSSYATIIIIINMIRILKSITSSSRKLGINFPMTSKEDVKGENAHPFYKWVKAEYGKSPKWNFHKFLIKPDGSLANSFLMMTKPKSAKVIKAIENILPND